MGTLLVALVVASLAVYAGWRFARDPKVGRPDPTMVFLYLTSLFVWGLLTGWLALRGFYEETTRYFAMDIATFVPFAVTGGFLALPRARRTLTQWAVSVSLQQYTWIHIIRIVAIGAIVKMLSGVLPAHFIAPVGIPDFLFGLSVPVVAWLAFGNQSIGRRGLIFWNVVGAVLFLPTLVLIYLSVPSPIQVFFEGPTTLEVFQFPMALVPTFLAPVFIIIHSAAIVKLSNFGSLLGEATER